MKSSILLSTIMLCITLFSCQNSGLSKVLSDLSANEENTSVIYLVRHAEKQDDGTRDPDLTEEGNMRAKKLASMLKSRNIRHVLSTDYKRTRNTAQPLADMLNVQVKIYDPRTSDMVDNILMKNHGDNFLIVGHSNSTPTLTNHILGQDKYEKLDESEYTQLFIVTKSKSSTKSATVSY